MAHGRLALIYELNLLATKNTVNSFFSIKLILRATSRTFETDSMAISSFYRRNGLISIMYIVPRKSVKRYVYCGASVT